MRAVMIGAVVSALCFLAATQFVSLASEVSDTAARLEVRSSEVRARLAGATYGADGRMVATGGYDRDAFNRDMNQLATDTEIIASERELASERLAIAGALGAAGTIALVLAAWSWRRRRLRGTHAAVRTTVLEAQG